ncbi:MAG: anti-sigma factor [Actinomycetota bacterium]
MDVHELTAAYALHALDSEEREAYEAHLGSCAECREELAALGETAAALAWGVESPAPPPALRGRILAAAMAERANVIPLPVRRPWVVRTAAAVAAVAACAAVALGVWATTLSHSLDSERSARAAEARAVQILMDPNSKKVALRGGNGTVAVDQTGHAVLVVNRLAPAPADKVYEAWVIPPRSKPIRAGTFKGGGSMTIVPLEEPVPKGSVVATTVERAGGVDSPTSTPIMIAKA